MTQVVLKSGQSVAEGFHRVFERAITSGERLRLIIRGDPEEYSFSNVSEAVFYDDGFLVVTPEYAVVTPYASVLKLSSMVRE